MKHHRGQCRVMISGDRVAALIGAGWSAWDAAYVTRTIQSVGECRELWQQSKELKVNMSMIR